MDFSNFLKLLLHKTRYVNRWLIFVSDLVLSLTSSYLALLFVAYALHNNLQLVTHFEILFFSLLASTAGLMVFSTYKGVIRHSTIAEAGRVALSAIIKIALMIPVTAYFLTGANARFITIGAVMDLMITFTLFVLFRVLILVTYRYILYSTNTRQRERMLIYIGGDTPITLSGTIFSRLGLYSVEGYILIGNFSVLRAGSYTQYTVPNFESFNRLVHAKKIKYVLFTNRQDLENESERLVRFCERVGVKMLLLPKADVVDPSHGIPSMNHIPEVKIEDLLGRDEIEINMDEISSCLEGKSVLVTGAAGSIGSELCRQLCKFGIRELVLFDSAETPMHNIRLELEEKCVCLKFNPIVGDVRSERRLDYIFRKYRPEIVFHAAAYKHVPLMEENPCEAVITNVFGTRLLADKAVEYGVEKFVMVSTDKAVNPTNVMGATKRIAEVYVQSLSMAIARGVVKGNTRFITTRFGNVLGSNGSVIPRFREQIMKGGPVTVTHPDIIRYFMTIPEACRLVLEAAAMGNGNEIFVFDMGTPVRIADLARRMIELSGMEPGKDIDIVYTGLRPGEKLYEELLATKENTLPTTNEKIFRAHVREYDYNEMTEVIDRLVCLARQVDRMATVKLMKELIPEFISRNSVYSALDSNENNNTKI